MSVESAKSFLGKFKSDADFRKQFQALGDDAAKKAWVKKGGFDFTKAEIKQVAQAGGELSDAQLAAVSGGKSATWVAVGISAGIEVAAAGL